MTKLTRTAFKNKWTGLFPDNSSAEIKEIIMREFKEDVADSFLNDEDPLAGGPLADVNLDETDVDLVLDAKIAYTYTGTSPWNITTLDIGKDQAVIIRIPDPSVVIIVNDGNVYSVSPDLDSAAANGNMYVFEKGGAINYGFSPVASTSAPVINPPTGLQLTNIQADRMTLTFTGAVGATSYLVDVATDAAFLNLVGVYDDFSIVTTSLVITGLLGNTEYFVRVQSFDNVNTSTESAAVNATTTNVGLVTENAWINESVAVALSDNDTTATKSGASTWDDGAEGTRQRAIGEGIRFYAELDVINEFVGIGVDPVNTSFARDDLDFVVYLAPDAGDQLLITRESGVLVDVNSHGIALAGDLIGIKFNNDRVYFEFSRDAGVTWQNLYISEVAAAGLHYLLATMFTDGGILKESRYQVLNVNPNQVLNGHWFLIGKSAGTGVVAWNGATGNTEAVNAAANGFNFPSLRYDDSGSDPRVYAQHSYVHPVSGDQVFEYQVTKSYQVDFKYRSNYALANPNPSSQTANFDSNGASPTTAATAVVSVTNVTSKSVLIIECDPGANNDGWIEVSEVVVTEV